MALLSRSIQPTPFRQANVNMASRSAMRQRFTLAHAAPSGPMEPSSTAWIQAPARANADTRTSAAATAARAPAPKGAAFSYDRFWLRMVTNAIVYFVVIWEPLLFGRFITLEFIFGTIWKCLCMCGKWVIARVLG